MIKDNGQPADGNNPFELDATRIGSNGKLTYRVFARTGPKTLHGDIIDLGRAKDITKFLDDLAGEAAQQGLPVDRQRCKEALLQYAADSSSGLERTEDSVQRPDFEPDPVLDAFGIEVLGESQDQAICVWSTHTKKTWMIKNPGRWNVQEMRQAMGKKADELLWPNPNSPPPPDKYTPADLQRAVALKAAESRRIATAKLIGQGIWLRNDDILIVNGDEASVYKTGKLNRLSRPRFGDEIIDFNTGRKWAGKVFETLLRVMTAKVAFKQMNRLEEILNKWNWTHKWDARVATLLVVATFVQACWTWRPLVFITGPSDCGKSTLFSDLLHAMFGVWTIAADRSTEAGLRQAIGHDAAPVLIDEFDKYQHRQKVFELFRTASRGGNILRGTQNQDGQKFGVKHIAWFAAIESGDIWGQDSNRLLRMELRPPKNRGQLSIPDRSELGGLGQALAAVALWAAPTAIPLADRIKSTKVKGVHGRIVESFSVVAAMDAVIRHGHQASEQQAVRALHAFLHGRNAVQEQAEPNESRLLRDILASAIRVQDLQGSGYAERTIGQLVEDVHKYKRHRDDLETIGIRLIERRGTGGNWALFVAHDVVRAKLLCGSQWSVSRIDQLLRRLPGAERTQQHCGGQRHPGVCLPWPACLGIRQP